MPKYARKIPKQEHSIEVVIADTAQDPDFTSDPRFKIDPEKLYAYNRYTIADDRGDYESPDFRLFDWDAHNQAFMATTKYLRNLKSGDIKSKAEEICEHAKRIIGRVMGVEWLHEHVYHTIQGRLKSPESYYNKLYEKIRNINQLKRDPTIFIPDLEKPGEFLELLKDPVKLAKLIKSPDEYIPLPKDLSLQKKLLTTLQDFSLPISQLIQDTRGGRILFKNSSLDKEVSLKEIEEVANTIKHNDVFAFNRFDPDADENYIAHPKATGYSSWHLITPLFDIDNPDDPFNFEFQLSTLVLQAANDANRMFFKSLAEMDGKPDIIAKSVHLMNTFKKESPLYLAGVKYIHVDEKTKESSIETTTANSPITATMLIGNLTKWAASLYNPQHGCDVSFYENRDHVEILLHQQAYHRLNQIEAFLLGSIDEETLIGSLNNLQATNHQQRSVFSMPNSSIRPFLDSEKSPFHNCSESCPHNCPYAHSADKAEPDDRGNI
jgi:ppGpp synthetase/RelA/SpoT-type nucleotidyltranferase